MQLIDKNSPLPYYYQLANILRREIEERRPLGEVYQLPSENELVEHYAVSRATVRHALAVLSAEGWIYRERGRGSFAPVRRVEQDLTRLVSTTEDMQKRGWTLVTRIISVQRLPAAPHIAHALELAERNTLYEVQRVRVVEGEPLSLERAHLPENLCPGLEMQDLTRSLYRLLEERYNLRLWTARETLRARPASPYEAQMLEIREGTCVMYVERVTYSVEGTPIEYLESVWRGDRYDFKVTLTRS